MSWIQNVGSFFGGGNSQQGWGNIFSAVLGGIANKSAQKDALRADKENTREAGHQNRQGSAFDKALDNYYTQKNRHEAARALGTYNQFSNVRNFAPNYVAGPGLDAMPTLPQAKDYT